MRIERAGARLLVSALIASLVVIVPASARADAAGRDITVFACPTELESPFLDTRDSVHHAAIACAAYYDLVGGTSATSYNPSGVVTRGQMATFIARMLGFIDLVRRDVPSAGFADTAGSPHELSIDAVVAAGVAQGTSGTTFSPTAPVSRAQMATFLRRAISLLGPLPATTPHDSFGDDTGNPHEDAINLLAGWGIVTGTAWTVYSPEASVSRAAMASLLVRTVDFGIMVGIWMPNIQGLAVAALVGPGGAVGTTTLMTTDVQDVLCYAIEVIGTDAPLFTDVRAGTPEDAGPVIIRLRAHELGNVYYGCRKHAEADRVVADPGSYYVEVRTDAYPNGALRGQLGGVTAVFEAQLREGAAAPGSGEPDVVGIASGFTTSESDVICMTTLVIAGEPPTAVHLHDATDVEILSFAPLHDLGHAQMCRTTPRAAEVAANPAGFYVDVHTASMANGAIRGQLRAVAGSRPPSAPLVTPEQFAAR